MFATTQTNKEAKTVAEGQPQRADAATGKDSPEPNPVWQSLALSPLSIQPKLAISQPDDPYEREADHIADRVMRMADPSPDVQVSSGLSTPDLRRMCSGCEEELDEGAEKKEKAVVQANEVQASGPQATRPIESQLSNIRSGGEPLTKGIRSFFEPRFGRDFDHVRIHEGSNAVEAATSVNARAFTIGRDIVFGNGQYAPDRQEGRRLLAHELTHVVQQVGVQPSSLNSVENAQRTCVARAAGEDRCQKCDEEKEKLPLEASATETTRPMLLRQIDQPSQEDKITPGQYKINQNGVRLVKDPARWADESQIIGRLPKDSEVYVEAGQTRGGNTKESQWVQIKVTALPKAFWAKLPKAEREDIFGRGWVVAKFLTPIEKEKTPQGEKIPEWFRAPDGTLHIDIGGEGKYPLASNLNPGSYITTLPTRGSTPGALKLKIGDKIPRHVFGYSWAIPIGDKQADKITVESAPIDPSEIARVIKSGGTIELFSADNDETRAMHKEVIDLVKGKSRTEYGPGTITTYITAP